MHLLEGGLQSRMQVEDSSQVGNCRRAAQRLAESNEFDDTLVGRVGIVATELANNLVKHAVRGELLLQAIHDTGSVTIELLAIDRGPGMQIERCMRDGYSTGGTAGTGLGAIARLSSFFDVYSAEGQGTVAVSRIEKQAGSAKKHGLEFGAISIALAGQAECGDTWRIADSATALAMMVADGLGHGPLAATAAQAAAVSFTKRPFDPPSEVMQRLHDALSGGRGAAAACALFNAGNSRVSYSGVGNISGSLVSTERSRGMVSHNGTLGAQLLRRQQFEYECSPGDRIVMHSDGMSARWSLSAYPGLFLRHAAVIAGVLYRDHARARDDVTVLVLGIRP
jgi:anti-sigma regulatory factor (Ser/Thr protein kinase)